MQQPTHERLLLGKRRRFRLALDSSGSRSRSRRGARPAPAAQVVLKAFEAPAAAAALAAADVVAAAGAAAAGSLCTVRTIAALETGFMAVQSVTASGDTKLRRTAR